MKHVSSEFTYMSMHKQLTKFYPPTKRFEDIVMSLESVCLSINILVSALELEYSLEYFDDTSHLCRTGHDTVSCRIKNESSHF